MAYTDTTLTSVSVRKTHLAELSTALTTLAANAALSAPDLSGMTYEKINSVNVKLLQDAIHTLESAFSGNCCEANCCQTCQSCQGCQSCQKCQSCQQAMWRYKKSSSNCDYGDDGI